MHLFTSHRRNVRRYHANFDLPENPLCWAFGHRPVAEVRDQFPPGWVLVECRWCGRRMKDDPSYDAKATPEERKERAMRRLEFARRDPVAFAASYDRRQRGEARLELSLETVDRRDAVAKRGLVKVLLDNLGFSVRVGTKDSESPYHVHLDAGVVGVYASAGGGSGKLAQWISRGHKRELSLQLHGGHAWWKLWYNDDGGNDSYHRCDSWRQPTVWPWSKGRRKHRGWMCLRDGNLELNPADALWGRPTPDRAVVEDNVTLGVPMREFPGDSYLITGTLERWLWRREHGPKRFAKRSVTYHFDWRCDPGIPVRNHDWKGDEVLGSSVTLTAEEAADVDGWKALVVERVIDQMKRDRRRYNYTPRVPS